MPNAGRKPNKHKIYVSHNAVALDVSLTWLLLVLITQTCKHSMRGLINLQRMFSLSTHLNKSDAPHTRHVQVVATVKLL